MAGGFDGMEVLARTSAAASTQSSSKAVMEVKESCVTACG